MYYPKITIVTPSYNQGAFLEQTIQSVLSQGYPNLEYIIIDGGSTDNSVAIIKQYESQLAYWVSEPDGGMYFALQKGFSKSTGDIMGWLNSDDMLHPNALFAVAEILMLQGVEWIQGVPSLFDEKGRTVAANPKERWSHTRFLCSDHAYIQQESTYWKRSLWNKAGGYISTDYKLIGDFELWSRFFKNAPLYTPKCLIGGYRLRTSGQLTQDYSKYTDEADQLLKKLLSNSALSKNVADIKSLKRWKRRIHKSRFLNISFINTRIEKKLEALYDYPPAISFLRETQQFSLAQP